MTVAGFAVMTLERNYYYLRASHAGEVCVVCCFYRRLCLYVCLRKTQKLLIRILMQLDRYMSHVGVRRLDFSDR